jgi:hypothetical protein
MRNTRPSAVTLVGFANGRIPFDHNVGSFRVIANWAQSGANQWRSLAVLQLVVSHNSTPEMPTKQVVVERS